MSTLVVAVAGFYFGTRSAEAARRAVEQPKLLIISPRSPVELDVKKEKSLRAIMVETMPRDEAVIWEIEGDPDGKLVQVKPNELEYTPSDARENKDRVTLKFSLAKYPDVSEKTGSL